MSVNTESELESEKGLFSIRNASSFYVKEIFYVCLLTIMKGLCYTILCTSNCCGISVGWEILPILALYYDHIITLWVSKLWKNIPRVKAKFYNTFLDSTCVCTDIVAGILAFKKMNLEVSCNSAYCYMVFFVWLLAGGIHCIFDFQVPNHIFHAIVFVCVMSLSFFSKGSVSHDVIVLVNKSSEAAAYIPENGTNFAYYIRTLIFLIVVISDSVCCKPVHQKEIERIYAIRYGLILLCPSKLLLYVVIATLIFIGFAVYKKDYQNYFVDKEKGEDDDCTENKNSEKSESMECTRDAKQIHIDISNNVDKQKMKTKFRAIDTKKGTINRKNANENGINYESLDVNEAFLLAQKLQLQNLTAVL